MDPRDQVVTPDWAAAELLQAPAFKAYRAELANLGRLRLLALDPCCGPGTFARVLGHTGITFHNYDIDPVFAATGLGHDGFEDFSEQDFLDPYFEPALVDVTIMNPPYISGAHAFVSKALACGGPHALVCSLMPLEWMAQKRWQRLLDAWKHDVHVLNRRPFENVRACAWYLFGPTANGIITRGGPNGKP